MSQEINTLTILLIKKKLLEEINYIILKIDFIKIIIFS